MDKDLIEEADALLVPPLLTKEAEQDLLDKMLDYMLEKVMPLGSRVARGLSYL